MAGFDKPSTTDPRSHELLTASEEEGLLQYLHLTKKLGLPVSSAHICQAAQSILDAKEEAPGLRIFPLNSWIEQFLDRHTHLKIPAHDVDGSLSGKTSALLDVERRVKITPQAHDLHVLGLHTRYSSWTARVITVLEYFQIPYSATFINVYTPGGKDLLHHLSPASLVPLLTTTIQDTPLHITDSLSILEYIAETNPNLPLWPRHPALRALARSAVAEMHAGFGELRNLYGTNYVAKYTGNLPRTEQGDREIERMLGLWGESRRATARILGEEGGDDGWLFGGFGIADAYFWPVLWRFRSYDLSLDSATPEALAWMRKMWSDPVIRAQGRDYFLQVDDPDTRIEKYDDVFSDRPDVQVGVFDENWVFPH